MGRSAWLPICLMLWTCFLWTCFLSGCLVFGFLGMLGVFSLAADKFDAALDLEPQVDSSCLCVSCGRQFCHPGPAGRLHSTISKPPSNALLPPIPPTLRLQNAQTLRLGGQSLLDAGLCLAAAGDPREAKAQMKVGGRVMDLVH